MDLLQETPSTGWLNAVIGALRKAKELGTKLPVFEPGSMLSKALDGPTLGGLVSEGGLHELSNWSHGNLPFEMQPGTGIPRIRSDVQGSRGSDVIDAAGMLPFGTAGSAVSHAGPTAGSLAHLIPILPGLNKDKLAVKNLAARVKQAVDDIRAGATANASWQKNRVERIGGGPWRHEIVDPTEISSAAIDPRYMEDLREGTYKFKDFQNQPELLSQYPWLKKVGVKVFSEDDPGGVIGSSGFYRRTEGPSGTIGLHDFDVGNAKRVFPHEVSHAIEALSNQTNNLGYLTEPLSPDEVTKATSLVQTLQNKQYLPTLQKHIQQVIADSTSTSPKRAGWMSDTGENLADLAAARTAYMTPEERILISPSMQTDYTNLVPSNVSSGLKYATNPAFGSPEASLNFLLRYLRNTISQKP